MNATGGTTYGPFTADVLLRPGAQLAVDIRRVVFAGIDFAGRVSAENCGRSVRRRCALRRAGAVGQRRSGASRASISAPRSPRAPMPPPFRGRWTSPSAARS
ncbi:hypothetical protein AB5I41_30190 [Sphingomonas sp. MMS24-JH45]